LRFKNYGAGEYPIHLYVRQNLYRFSLYVAGQNTLFKLAENRSYFGSVGYLAFIHSFHPPLRT